MTSTDLHLRQKQLKELPFYGSVYSPLQLKEIQRGVSILQYLLRSDSESKKMPKIILRKTNPSVQNSESPKTRFSIKMIKMIKINTEMFILFTIIIQTLLSQSYHLVSIWVFRVLEFRMEGYQGVVLSSISQAYLPKFPPLG